METDQDAGRDERQRLERFLAWRRGQGEGRLGSMRRWLPYVVAVGWLGAAVITGALLTTLAGSRGVRGGVVKVLRPTPGPSAPDPVLSVAKPAPAAEPAASVRILPVAQPERALPVGVTHEHRRTARPIAKGRAVVTTAIGTLERWAGHIPEARPSKAIVRWVRSQPPATGVRPPEPAQPQAR